MTIQEARATVKQFVSRWTDQKLTEVLAFCQDGKMAYNNSCSCLLGVDGSDVLHTGKECENFHYYHTRRDEPGASEAEVAYFFLGSNLQATILPQTERNDHLTSIIEEVMMERAVQKHFADTDYETVVARCEELMARCPE